MAVILRHATQEELNVDGTNVYVVLDLIGPDAGKVKGWGAYCTPVGHIDRSELETYLCGGADRIGYNTRRDATDLERGLELIDHGLEYIRGAS
jgi:hypothetical protein